MDPRSVRPATGLLDVDLAAPPSKSDTHRALVAAALARGRSTILSPLLADDTRATADGLCRLGFTVLPVEGGLTVRGLAGHVPGGGALSLGQSGTSARFLLAVAALGERASHVDGEPRLRQRPIGELVAALTELGARPSASRLPLRIGGSPLAGCSLRVPARHSSQFASALLLIAARVSAGVELELEAPHVSLPYVEMTVDTLRRFRVRVDRPARHRFRVAPCDYRGIDYAVAGDHSSGGYWLAAAAMAGGRVRVTGLDPQSPQPDARLGALLADAGCRVRRGADWVEVRGPAALEPFDLDLTDAPDLAPTIAVLGLCSPRRSVLGGVSHLRHKESDRLQVLAANLNALGRAARAEQDRLIIDPASGPLRGTTIRTASDHRIAMAFAIAGLRIAGITLDDPACVSKSNPGFWNQLANLEG